MTTTIPSVLATGLSLALANPAGACSIGPSQSLATDGFARQFAIGDLNGNGRNDVALVTSSYSDPVNDYRAFDYLKNAQAGLNPPRFCTY